MLEKVGFVSCLDFYINCYALCNARSLVYIYEPPPSYNFLLTDCLSYLHSIFERVYREIITLHKMK